MDVQGRFTFTKRTAGQIVQVEKSNNMFMVFGAAYMMKHFFRDDPAFKITLFYLGLLDDVFPDTINYTDVAITPGRDWRERVDLGNRQLWTPSLIDWPSEVNNRSSLARWTVPPGYIGTARIRGAFLVNDDALVYTSPPSSNTGRGDPLAASKVPLASLILLDANDTLDVEYSVQFT